MLLRWTRIRSLVAALVGLVLAVVLVSVALAIAGVRLPFFSTVSGALGIGTGG
jgi:small-conductance mechanosensitive channel